GAFIALDGGGLYLDAPKAQAQPASGSAAVVANSPNGPDIVRLVGPVCRSTDLRDLPYIPPSPQIPRDSMTRYIQATTEDPVTEPSHFAKLPTMMTGILRPVPLMPPPLLTFEGTGRDEGDGDPPDTNGDVGPNHYVQAVNNAFKVFDKNGNTLSGPTTFNSFFAPLGTSTPCGLSEHKTDPFVLYDQMADRWVISDHANDYDKTTFQECIGVSRTGDPV